ncbi:F0F1 ATP synthase subunit delta [Candidatus Omnitrophota bacterium]
MLIIPLIIFQVIIFVTLIYFLRHILSRNVTSATKHLEGLDKEYSKREKKIIEKTEKSKQECSHIVSKAKNEAEMQRIKIIKEAEVEKDKILKQAHMQSEEIVHQADRSKQNLLSEFDRKVEEKAIDKACELIQTALPEHFKRDVHLHWVEELIRSGFNKGDGLSVSEDIKHAEIISAFTLSDQQKKELSGKLKTLVSHNIELEEVVDPKIVAGIIVSVGSLVFDGSFKNKIMKNIKDVKAEAAD